MKVVIPNRAESAVRNLLLATLLHEKHDMYIYIRIYMYNIMKHVHGAGFHRPEGMVRASTRMPFPGPETALPSTIGLEVKGSFLCGKIEPPAACQSTPTAFQSLTRRLNDLQKNGQQRMRTGLPIVAF